MSKVESTSVDVGVLDTGAVVIQFKEAVRQVVFSPEQAISLGVGLIQNGTRGESLQRAQQPRPNVAGPRRKQ